MRICYIYFLSLLFFFSGTFFPAQAQNIVKVGKGVVTTVTEKGLTSASAKVAVPSVVAPKGVTLPPVANTAPIPKYNAWVTSNKKILFSLQRKLGISAMKAGHNLQNWGSAPTVKPHLPIPMGEPFLIDDLSSLIPESQIGRGNMPVEENPQLIYRGMALDAEALKSILKNGMLLKDVTPASATQYLPYSFTTTETPNIPKEGFVHINNFTKSPALAANWASMKLSKKSTVVLVSVKSYKKGTFIVEMEDILPDKFYDVLAVLQINDNPTWCKVELLDEGYKITPYLK